MERSRSCKLRNDIKNVINIVSQEIWDAWGNSNMALAQRSNEMVEAKNKLQNYLHKVNLKFCFFLKLKIGQQLLTSNDFSRFKKKSLISRKISN